MGRTLQSWLGRCTGIALGAVLLSAAGAHAIYLDEDQNWVLRARLYSQATIRIQESRNIKIFSNATDQAEQTQTVPITKSGQLIQNRFFFNPELDVKLKSYVGFMDNTSWLKWLAPDDFRFRLAGWGFYDGIYDYGSSQFNDSQRLVNSSFDPAVPPSTAPGGVRVGGWYIESRTINVPPPGTPAKNFGDIFPGYELKTPRTTYGFQRRINELYLSYTKGPLFLRIGKQTISWGESDTIALLDQTNPFSILLGAPGFFQDVDEARIPLWTLRSSFNLFNTWGPLSSAFVEAYWVPGDLDTNISITPILTASPYSPAGSDPGRGNPIFPASQQFVFVDHIPKKRFENSRYGFRFQTVLNRFYTIQAWMYRTFPQAPVPVKVGSADDFSPIQVKPPGQTATSLFIISLEHKPTTVYGLATTFFVEPLDGIIRINAQLFENEPAFIPSENLRIEDNALLGKGRIPYADFLRWEVGFDRFFFFRPLNPTNSFVVVGSVVGQYNLDETGNKDFRFNGQLKDGFKCVKGQSTISESSVGGCQAAGGQAIQRGGSINDYVQLKTIEAQAQITLQSDWMHGKLSPRLTVIGFTRGTWAVHPAVTYRWSDWLLFGFDFQWIGGAYQSLGFFGDRGQVSARVTYQLN